MKRATMLVAAVAVTLSACGPDGNTAATSKQPTTDPDDAKVVNITMTDMAFNPSAVDAAPGETIKFVFHNDGKVKHEAVFGDLEEQQAHHEEMNMSHDTSGDGSMAHGDMSKSTAGHGSQAQHGSDEMHAVVVEPGDTVEVIHVVDQATVVGCHEPGHWEAGMKMEVSA